MCLFFCLHTNAAINIIEEEGIALGKQTSIKFKCLEKFMLFSRSICFVSFHSTDQSNMGLSVLRQSTEEHRL